MPSFDEAIQRVEAHVRRQIKLETDRIELLNSPFPSDIKDQYELAIKEELVRVAGQKEQELRSFLTFPPFHDRHRDKLAKFHADGVFERSVFVMTKYPDGAEPKDAALEKVVATVKEAVARCQHVPRLALDRAYHNDLWDNVELHLLGCPRGIAIVESKYRPELNPNVAMEWGWMRGMGRDVLYLIEEAFDQQRADWGGLIEYPFAWDEPEAKIPAAIHKWLQCPLEHG